MHERDTLDTLVTLARKLARVMLAGVFVSADSVTELASIVRATGGDKLADRLERALADNVRILALSIDERAIILAALDAPPDGLAELRGVFMNEHQWRQREGLDQPSMASSTVVVLVACFYEH